MKKIIKTIDESRGIFSVIHYNKLTHFYLTKRQSRRFMDYLDVGVYIDFKEDNEVKIVDNMKCYKVAYFNKIERKGHIQTKVLYDINQLRRGMKRVLVGFDYYLFLDLELTMPPYYKTKFETEIIQVGYILTDDQKNIIHQNQYYVKPSVYRSISKRTLKFLSLDRSVFDEAHAYDYFYNDLANLMRKYNPKIIVWGKNDVLALEASYNLNHKKPLTQTTDFINLLQMHKNYYNLSDDLGLFKAYEYYYGKHEKQEHDAFIDALITMKVYEGLKDHMESNHGKTVRRFKERNR